MQIDHPGFIFNPVRGSPIIRTLLLLCALVPLGVLIARMTANEKPARTIAQAQPTAETPTTTTNCRLELSAPAQQVVIDSMLGQPLNALSGSIHLNPQNPAVAVQIRFSAPPAEGTSHFALLTLEVPGQPAFSHTFSTTSDTIDDLVELPESPP